MPKVAVVAAGDPTKVLVGPLVLPFIPPVGKPLGVRKKETSASQDYMLTDIFRTEIVLDQPELSGVVFLGYPIPG